MKTNYLMNDKEIFEKLFELGEKSRDPDGIVVAGLIKDGEIIAMSPSADDGIRHAEDLVIEMAKEKNIPIGENTILYTSVEPCTFRNPEKKMTPCADLIIAAGIKEVVFAAHDPRYKHDSEKRLRDAGIKVRQIKDEEITKKALDLYSGKIKKITLFPGGFQSVKNYGYAGVDIWTGEDFRDELKDSDIFIGHSGGASFALQNVASRTSQYIFVNPLVKRRNLFCLFIRWLKYAFQEGLPMRKFIPVRHWPSALKKVIGSTKIDFLSAIKDIPKENVTVVRGEKDRFFCDEEAARIISENGVRLIEVDAGHDWNENIAEAVRGIINEG